MKRQHRTDWDAIHRRLERSREVLQRIDAEDRGRQEEILRQRAAALAAATDPALPATSAADCIEALLFEIAGERYAFETRHVGVVLPMVPLTPVPGVPDHVVGIVAVQSEVLSVLDLRSLLNLPLARLAETTAIIVLRSVDMEFGVLAESIGGIARYRLDALQCDVPGLGGDDRSESGKVGSGHIWLQAIAPDRTAILDAAGLLADPRLVVEKD